MIIPIGAVYTAGAPTKPLLSPRSGLPAGVGQDISRLGVIRARFSDAVKRLRRWSHLINSLNYHRDSLSES